MSIYDPDLTFEANARAILALKGDFAELDAAEALRECYEDGWMDARARQLAGNEIEEVPFKG